MTWNSPVVRATILTTLILVTGCATSTSSNSFCAVFDLQAERFLLRQINDAEWDALEPHEQQLALNNLAVYGAVCNE